VLLCRTIEIPIRNCVHFCGFRYGHGDYNPYESYATRLHYGENLDAIRDQFIDFLQYYRPRDMGQALGISLSRNYPLWLIHGRDFREQNTAFQKVGLKTPAIHQTYLRIFQTEESSGHELGKK